MKLQKNKRICKFSKEKKNYKNHTSSCFQQKPKIIEQMKDGGETDEVQKNTIIASDLAFELQT